ncbi:flagellin [Halioglobus sp. HI00S01]|uniref:flagellin N-terminal helical domain-containing protein n=1 Tax=Halioglobus sp. HI00S01 TaxID=1822214 RepID=UPI0007C24500|nr:flagellin [Halioglobus sp. HI00S01]KZX54885.1 flagellin [Halioglobus sp. HI00S01]
MSVINTNITALVAQQNLGSSQSALSTAMERLSSGLRINSAKDDAAGLAIANRISSQITGLMQAQRNANDGVSISQTAEGALDQVNDNLQRIRELSVQAANGTNSSSDLTSIQNEIQSRLDEIDRISAETSFNGVNVLAGDGTFTIQVGANDGEAITMNLRETSASTLGLSGFQVENTLLSNELSSSATTEITQTLDVKNATFADGGSSASYDIYVAGDDPDNGFYVWDAATSQGYVADYNTTTGVVTFDSSGTAKTASDLGTGSGEITAVSSGDGVFVGDGITINVDDLSVVSDTNSAATPALYQDVGGDYYVTLDSGDNYFTASVNFTTGVVSYTSGTNAITSSAATVSALSAQLTQITDNDVVSVDVSGITALTNPNVYAYSDGSGYVVSGNDADGNTAYYEATIATDGTVSLGNQLTADPLATLDAALTQVDVLRSELGAAQNRFESAITNLAETSTNLSAARSRIEDADYAVEVSNLTRAQILQQAGTSVLAQANQVPQTVLSLLG